MRFFRPSWLWFGLIFELPSAAECPLLNARQFTDWLLPWREVGLERLNHEPCADAGVLLRVSEEPQDLFGRRACAAALFRIDR